MVSYARTFPLKDATHTGRKFLLPKKLSKRTLIKVDTQGAYEIHYNIQQGATLVTQKDSAQTA